MEQEILNPSLDRQEIRGELERIIPAESMPGDEAAWEALLQNLERGSVEELLTQLPTFELMDEALRLLKMRKLKLRTLSMEFAREVLMKRLAMRYELSRTAKLRAEEVP